MLFRLGPPVIEAAQATPTRAAGAGQGGPRCRPAPSYVGGQPCPQGYAAGQRAALPRRGLDVWPQGLYR
jgi:hypothetical protein